VSFTVYRHTIKFSMNRKKKKNRLYTFTSHHTHTHTHTHCDPDFIRAIKLQFAQSDSVYSDQMLLSMATKDIIITTHHKNQSSEQFTCLPVARI